MIDATRPHNAPHARIGLAPMEGVVDVHTRALLTAIGGFDWVVTEFVRVVDTRLPARVFTRLCPELTSGATTSAGTPVTLQLLGSDPQALGENAQQAVACGASAIDINFGCPAKTVNRHRGGASLLQDADDVYQAVRGVVDALQGSNVRVSAKLRLGFNTKQLALHCACAAEAAGASHLTLHARTKKEGYRPPAHWEWVARVRQQVGIPVVVNGDIWTLEDFWKARSLSGCRDVMLGRSALADPWLARRIKHWQVTGERMAATRWQQRADVLQTFAERLMTVPAPERAPDKVIVSLLKQWLAIMRQHDAESDQRFSELKRINQLHEMLAALN
ncbi:tRNA-dihydrouridine(16) synthase [Carnimonas sp. R-84981]|uniref:tRNA dihydrouridine synthase n=1 Tax=Carnimonas bestiolae TaxID=3402172 RepID=UPI003EDB9CB4